MVRARELRRYDRAVTRCPSCGAWRLPEHLARTAHRCFPRRDAACYGSHMATEREMRRAAQRRSTILKLIREGVERDWAPPTATELAAQLGVSRRQASIDLEVLEGEGLIVQDTEHRPRLVKLTGYEVRVVPAEQVKAVEEVTAR